MSKYSIFNAHNRTLLFTEIYSIEAWQVLGLFKYHFTLFEQYVLSQMLMLDQYSCLLIMWYQCLVKYIFQFGSSSCLSSGIIRFMQQSQQGIQDTNGLTTNGKMYTKRHICNLFYNQKYYFSRIKLTYLTSFYHCLHKILVKLF